MVDYAVFIAIADAIADAAIFRHISLLLYFVALRRATIVMPVVDAQTRVLFMV